MPNPSEDPNNPNNWTGAQFEDGGGMTFNDRVPAFGGMSNGGGAAAMSPGGGSPMSQDPMAQKAFQKVQQYEGEARGAQQAGEQKEGPIRQKLMSVLESPPAAQAHLKEVQAQPKPEDYHKGALEFAGAMAVVGAIFGRGSRGSGNVALNAFGAALKGFQEGNLQAYTEATKEWEQATKATIANNQIELDKYKMIIEDKKLNIDQMSAAINLVSTETQNKIMFDMSMAKNYTGFLTAYDKQQAAQQRLELSLKRSQSLDEKSQAPLRAAAEDLVAHPEKGADYTAEQWAKIKGYADSHGIALPDQPQPKGSIPRSANAAATQKFMQENPHATAEDIQNFNAEQQRKNTGARSFASGPTANAVRSFSVAIDHLSVAEELGSALKNKDLQAANRLANMLGQETGKPAVTNFNFAKEIVGDEITKAILGSSIGSQADRLALKKGFDAANSPEQLSGVIRTAKKMMAGQLDGYKRQYEHATGQQDFDQMLSDRARQELQGLGGGTAPAASGAAPRARNPKTGAEVEWDGTQWQPVK